MRAFLAVVLVLTLAALGYQAEAQQICLGATPFGCAVLNSVGNSSALPSSVYCWGSVPAAVPSVIHGNYISVSCGSNHLCVLNATAHARCFGLASEFTPTLNYTKRFRQLSSRDTTVCGLTEDGQVQCAGSTVPVRLVGAYSSIAVTSRVVCGIRVSGTFC